MSEQYGFEVKKEQIKMSRAEKILQNRQKTTDIAREIEELNELNLIEDELISKEKELHLKEEESLKNGEELLLEKTKEMEIKLSKRRQEKNKVRIEVETRLREEAFEEQEKVIKSLLESDLDEEPEQGASGAANHRGQSGGQTSGAANHREQTGDRTNSSNNRRAQNDGETNLQNLINEDEKDEYQCMDSIKRVKQAYKSSSEINKPLADLKKDKHNFLTENRKVYNLRPRKTRSRSLY